MTRLTDNDRRCGPLTWGKAGWNPWRLVFSTGGEDEGRPRNHLTASAFGYVACLDLPTRFSPWRRWVDTSRYDGSNGPGSGYWDVHAREYGFCLSNGHLSLYMGAQTNDSITTKMWSCFLPWTQWRHIRRSFYDGTGKHFATEWDRPRGFLFRDTLGARQAVEKACPTAVFEFDDYDGQRIKATCMVQEREWRFGEGWFAWLSLFRKPKIRRSLDLEFSAEVGPEKGSWKGGTLGHGTDMQPGETAEEAFRRYCEQEHRSKHRRFRIKFVGAVSASQNASIPQAEVAL
jgi:hypothetical protein